MRPVHDFSYYPVGHLVLREPIIFIELVQSSKKHII